jgi:hypothetical protein
MSTPKTITANPKTVLQAIAIVRQVGLALGMSVEMVPGKLRYRDEYGDEQTTEVKHGGTVILRGQRDGLPEEFFCRITHLSYDRGYHIDGSTHYALRPEQQAVYCFDQRGIGPSFSIYPNTFSEDGVSQILKEQRDRIDRSREFDKTAIMIPGLERRVSPERLQQIKDKLSRGERVDFTPSGMGTGISVSTRRPSARGARYARYSRRPLSEAALAQMTEFLGVGPLYLDTFDHD